MELNIEKIDKELHRIGKRKSWLAQQMGISPAMVSYIYKKKPITFAKKIADVFGISGKDLISD